MQDNVELDVYKREPRKKKEVKVKLK